MRKRLVRLVAVTMCLGTIGVAQAAALMNAQTARKHPIISPIPRSAVRFSMSA